MFGNHSNPAALPAGGPERLRNRVFVPGSDADRPCRAVSEGGHDDRSGAVGNRKGRIGRSLSKAFGN